MIGNIILGAILAFALVFLYALITVADDDDDDDEWR